MAYLTNEKDLGLIKGLSIQIQSIKGLISFKDAYFLNEYFLDECEKYPYSKLIDDISYDPPKANVTDSSEVTVYLGRQIGEVVFKSSKEDGAIVHAFDKAMKAIKKHLRIVDDISAGKWFKLSQDGYFEQFRNEKLSDYWKRRINVDISSVSKMKKILNKIQVHKSKLNNKKVGAQ